MENNLSFEKWLTQHKRQVAKYRKLVAEYKKMYDPMLVSDLIDTYISLDKNCPVDQLSDNQSAMKEAISRCIKGIRGDQLNHYKGELVHRWNQTNNNKAKSELEETIEWLDCYMCHGKPMPIKPKVKNLPDIYDSGYKV